MLRARGGEGGRLLRKHFKGLTVTVHRGFQVALTLLRLLGVRRKGPGFESVTAVSTDQFA